MSNGILNNLQIGLKRFINDHIYNKNNPHEVTATQIGAATPAGVYSAVSDVQHNLNLHAGAYNPHEITKEIVGLSNLTNAAQIVKHFTDPQGNQIANYLGSRNAGSGSTLLLNANYYGAPGILSTTTQTLSFRSAGGYFHNYAANAYVPVYASAFTPSSSIRYKENIKDLTEEQVSALLKLRPVSYNLKHLNEKDCAPLSPNPNVDENGIRISTDLDYGFIAEEVNEIDDSYVRYNDKGQPEALNYSELIAPIVKLLQIQQEQINSLQQEIEVLKGGINASNI